MDVLPLEFKGGDSWSSLDLDGSDLFSINGIHDITPRKTLPVKAVKADGTKIGYEVTARLDTVVAVEYCLNGGILAHAFRKFIG